MSLLKEIQESVIHDGTDIGSILLKLRLLAAKLGSLDLEEWVKFESGGYHLEATLPEYRKIPVAYTGSFSGSFGAGIKNAPIPPYLIEQYAGNRWNKYELRQSIAAIDDLIGSTPKESGTLQINAANLILLLQGNVYEDMACNEIRGIISRADLVALRHEVKSRILELTIELEKSFPGSAEATFGQQSLNDHKTAKEVTQIFQQIIHGSVTSINSSGDGAHIHVQIEKGNASAFETYLVEAGIPKIDARELAEIVASDEAGDKREPLGEKTKSWLVNNLHKAIDGTWKVGLSVATELIKKAVLKYYGLDN